MITYLILWVLILIIGTIVCFKILRSIAKTVVIAAFILLLFLVITATLAYSDIQDLKQDIAEKQFVIIVHRDHTLLFSAVEYNIGDDALYKEPDMSDEGLQDLLTKSQYSPLLYGGSYDTVVSIHTDAYDPLTKKTALLTIIEDTSMSFDSRAAALDELNDALLDKETLFLIQQYKSGNILVYPKTIAFYMIDIVPESWSATLMNKAT